MAQHGAGMKGPLVLETVSPEGASLAGNCLLPGLALLKFTAQLNTAIVRLQGKPWGWIRPGDPGDWERARQEAPTAGGTGREVGASPSPTTCRPPPASWLCDFSEGGWVTSRG